MARLVLVDRDGVVNEDSVDYVRTPAEWRPIPGSLEALALLHRAGFLIAVVTNQAGIGRGLMTERDLTAVHAKMTAAVRAAGGELAGIFHCPHAPRARCDCRKPAPGLLVRAAAQLGVALEGVPFVGDKGSDLEAARRAGARPVLVRTGYGAATESALGDSEGVDVYPDLLGAARALLAEGTR